MLTRVRSFFGAWPESAYRSRLFMSAVSVMFWLCCGFFAGAAVLGVVTCIQGGS